MRPGAGLLRRSAPRNDAVDNSRNCYTALLARRMTSQESAMQESAMRNVLRLCAGLALACAVITNATAQPSGRLMVYTSQPSGQMAKVVEAFNKAHPKVQVSLYRSGTTEVMNRLQAEFAA